MTTFINPTSDIFIKYLLGSEKNKDLLISFVNAVITDSEFSPIVSVEIKDPFNIKGFPIDKESIVDIKATDETGKCYDIEVQSTGNENFKNRSLYYWAKLYSSQLQEKDFYTKLKPTICINVLNFILFKELDYVHSCFLLREINNLDYVLTDHIILHFLELTKLKDIFKDNKLIRWLLFLKNEGTDEDIMKILIKDDEIIAKAHKEYEHFINDEGLRNLYESRLKWKLDYNTDIEIARQEGIERGREKGREEGREEGRVEGKVEEKQSVLIRLLSKKFGLLDNEKKIIKSIHDYEKLDKAIESIIFTAIKDEILTLLK